MPAGEGDGRPARVPFTLGMVMSRTQSALPRAAHRALFTALPGLVIGVPATAAAQSDARAVAGGMTGGLAGTVTDPSGVPIGGATVRIPAVARAATTDSAGGFRLDGLAPGRHTLTARAPRFAPAESSITIVAGAMTRVAIRLQPVGAVRLRQVLVRERAAPGAVWLEAVSRDPAKGTASREAKVRQCTGAHRASRVRHRRLGPVG